MKCPFCGHENTRVIDSRPAEENNSIRRRRVCDECNKRFTTYEKIETIPLIIMKKDNNRETYDRAKIEAGVLRACHKRPVSAAQISQLVDEVETEIFSTGVRRPRALFRFPPLGNRVRLGFRHFKPVGFRHFGCGGAVSPAVFCLLIFCAGSCVFSLQ